jgi:RHS repeat-associated protein
MNKKEQNVEMQGTDPVTSANKYFRDGTPMAGQQFDYSYDSIGNRTSAQSGGDQTGSNLRWAGYMNNLLNQITNRNVPGYVDVMGLTLATNTVSVNGQAAYQKWDYFREQLAVNNSAGALWTNITVTAPGQATNSGHVYVGAAGENFTYDLDGNLTSDGRWTNTWDAENRLVSMTALNNTPVASQYSLSFAYDYMGRRIQKIVSTNSGTGYVAQYTNRFVYDGWNLVGILDGGNNLLYSFTWGTDLSGSMQGAGGVGGAISMTVYSGTNAGTYFYCYDGNGNVVALVSATNGAIAAQYEYGPFGELIRATGPMAKVNPFMFSTKYYDWESALYYYGCRYYNPSTGRFINRDPMEEGGGMNLYETALNDLIDQADYLGFLTVGADLSILRKEATSWRAKGWQFAPNLLTAFYMKSGGYTPSKYDIDLIKNSDEYRKAAQKEFESVYKTTIGTGASGGRVAIAKGRSKGPYAFEPNYTSGELFYALGGAHFYYTGYMIYCSYGHRW